MTRIIGAPTLDDALAALCERVTEYEGRGENTLVFCEDRVTLLAERAVLSAVGGTFLTEVTTFARFLSGEGRVLSKQGSVVEISALLSEYAEELQCFRKGAAQAVYETIAQLSASKVDAAMLREGAGETEGMLPGKLSDLAFLIERYNEFLHEKGMVDENGYLALLPGQITKTVTAQTHVIFFAFSSFTRQAREGIRAALGSAADVTGIFLAGRSGLYTNESAHLFRMLCEEEGEAVSSMKKCSLTEDALILRDGLFSPETLSSPVKTSAVRRFTAQDEAEEMEIVAALIKKHVAEGLRYKDVAVLVQDKSGFAVAERAFSAYKIPFFADKKRPFSENPFCVFLLNVLSAVSDGVLPDEADAVAASVYFGNGDSYRNYLLKYGGYRGAVKRAVKEGEAVKRYNREELVACREKMLAVLGCFPAKGKGKAFTDGVRELSRIVDAEAVTQTLQESFSGAEQDFLSPDPLFEVLDEIDLVAADRKFTAREFYAMLKSGLDAKEISMLPKYSDAVFVGDATESRFGRVRVLFATGLDALPRSSQDTAVITDGEIERLKTLKMEIEPAIAQVNARARESLALNLCAFGERLYLSYPLKRGEEETSRGEIMQYAERLFDMPPMPDLFPYECSERQPALLKLLSWKQAYESGRIHSADRFSSLYAALAQTGEDTDALLLGRGKEQVREAGALYFADAVSPTLLERYFACPYAGFAISALRLREREEKTVLDTDAGTFVHAVLQTVADRFNEIPDEAECFKIATTVGKNLLQTPRFAALSDTDAGIYTGERLVREGAAVTVGAYRQLSGSAFRVGETEQSIALPEISLKGKADRIDVSDDYIRVIDYKTGSFEDAASAYYTGRKLQLELYLRAASQGKKAAGAFYFPATDDFSAEDAVRFCMSGFYSAEDEVVTRMDVSLGEGEKSVLFDGRRGKFTDKGMKQEDFEDFLDYSLLVSRRAEEEMKQGNIAPSPHEGVCSYCKLKSLCGFVGAPRGRENVKCADVVAVVRREKGEE